MIARMLLAAAAIAVAAPASAAIIPSTTATTFSTQASFLAATGATTALTPDVSTNLGAAIGVGLGNIGTSGGVTFTFASAVNSFGVNLLNVGALGSTTTVSAITNTGTSVELTSFAGLAASKFVGFSDSANSFTSITLRSNQATTLVGFSGLVAANIGPAPAAAVPEPATWAMMLLGFGMVAATARYRRRSTKVAYA